MNSQSYDILEHLVAFDTVSANSNIPAIEYLAERLHDCHFATKLHRLEIARVPQANLIASVGPATSGGLILSGHVDTVPVAGQPGWNYDPFKLTAVDDRLIGRGTSDMKGFLAQCVEAAQLLEPARLKRPVVFVFTAAEEIGMLGAKHAAPVLQEMLGEVPRPSLAWIGEPTSYSVYHAHKSIVSFQVTVRGRGGHGGAPERGVSAIAVMGKVVETIGRYQADRCALKNRQFIDIFPDAPYDVMNLGTVAGGVAVNIIAEEAILRMTYRSLPGSDPLEIYHELERRLAAIDRHDYAGGDFTATIELGQPAVGPPMLAPRGTPLERELFAVTGMNHASGAPFATDAAWFSGAGVTSLICGPGDYDQAHRPNESIGRVNFERGPALILEVIDRLCCR